jgi:hypothetical protein
MICDRWENKWPRAYKNTTKIGNYEIGLARKEGPN